MEKRDWCLKTTSSSSPTSECCVVRICTYWGWGIAVVLNRLSVHSNGLINRLSNKMGVTGNYSHSEAA